MRLVHAAALTAAALLLASVASAQGLGDAAAREREKRKTGAAPAKPAKVFTESDLGASSSAPAPAAGPEGAAGTAGGANAGTAAGAAAADAGAKPKTEAELAADAEKQQQKAAEEWRGKLDEARKQEQQYKEQIDRIQLDLNDTSGLYSAARARRLETLEDAKRKLAEAQARTAELEEQGRRSNYR